MKQMLMGIFLLLLGVWCYLFGVVDQAALFAVLGVLLPIPAVLLTLYGFFNKNKSGLSQSTRIGKKRRDLSCIMN